MADKSKTITYGSDHLVSVAGTTMLCTSENLAGKYEWDEPSETGMIGTDKPANSGRQVIKNDVSGEVVIRPSYTHADTILDTWFDGTTAHTPADSPSSKTAAIVIDRDVDIYTYADCWLKSLKLSANENEPVDWTLDILGTTETDAGSVSALTLPDKMLMSDLTLTINANTYFVQGFEWMFDYAFQERFHQSVTRSSVTEQIPMCTLQLTTDINSDTWADLFALAGTDTALEDVNMVFTDGVNSLTIAHPEMTVMNASKWPDSSGADATTGTLELRAWLASGESDIVTLTTA